MKLPLFPLKVVLYPGQPLPLHIFEPRYRLMVQECDRLERPFGVVLNLDDEVAQVGTTARIRKFLQVYEDGRKDILTVGEQRFRVVETFEDQPYLTAEIEPLLDPPETPNTPLRERAITQHMKLLELFGQQLRPTDYDKVEVLSYFLALNAGLDLPEKQKLLELEGENQRITWLVDHFETLIPRLREAEHLRERARSDGYYSDQFEA